MTRFCRRCQTTSEAGIGGGVDSQPWTCERCQADLALLERLVKGHEELAARLVKLERQRPKLNDKLEAILTAAKELPDPAWVGVVLLSCMFFAGLTTLVILGAFGVLHG